MAMILRQSTASQEILLGPFVDSADGNTAETALSIANTDIKIFKEGATTLADKNSGGATHISNGYYYTVLDATDTNTVGQLEVNVKVSGALAVRREFQVVEEAVYDALFAASAAGYQVPIWAAAGSTVNLSGTTVKAVTDRVTANTDQWNGTAVTSATVRSDLINIAGVAVSTSTAQLGVNVVNFGGSAGTFSSGRPEVNATHWGGTAVASALVRGNLIQVNGSATPVTNIATVFDTDFALNYDAVDDRWIVDVASIRGESVTHSGAFDFDTLKTAYQNVNTYLDTSISSRMATYTQPTGFLAATFPTTVASTTNITAGTITTVTNVTTVNGIAANAITASSLATDAVDEIADGVWNEPLSGHLTAGSTGNALNAAGSAGDPWSTSLPGAYGAGSAGYILGTNLNATISSRSSHSASDVWAAGTRTLTALDEDSTTLDLDATIRAAVGMASANLDTQLTDIDNYIDTEVAAIKTVTDRLDTAMELDGSVYRFTTNALEQAPSGSLTTAAIANAVWNEALSGHLTAGSTGNALNAAGSAGDPWSTTLPGSYTGTQAGFIIGTIRAAQLNILSPHVAEDSSMEIVIGDDYYAADNRNLSFSYGASPSLSGATVTLEIQEDTTAEDSDTNYTSTSGTVSGTNPQVVSFDLPGTTTADLSEGWHAYRVKAVLSNSHTVTLTRGRINLLARGDDAP